MTEELWWQAVLRNDKSYDGVFVYAVASTGIFCRPSCVSRPPNRKNVRFFRSPQDAARAGFRPCKRCRPDLDAYAPEQDTARELRALLEAAFADSAALEAGLKRLGLSRRRLETICRQTWGCSIAEEVEHLRLERAKLLLRESRLSVPQAAFEAGYGSLSAFYRRFRAAEGCTPAQYRRKEELR